MNETNGHRPARGTRQGKGNIDIEAKAEMVAALPAFDNCKSEVARQFGVSEHAVRLAVADPQVVELVEVKKEQIARKLGLLVDKLTQRFIDLADGATLDNKAAVLLGIAADKHRLYSEQPTQITESRTDAALREDARKSLADLLAACEGDETRARALLAENAPTLSRYIN